MGVSFSIRRCSEQRLRERMDDAYENRGSVTADKIYEASILDSVGLSNSYPGFGVWRRSIARLVGIELDHMKGFGGGVEWPEWDGSSPSLVPLLEHPDNRGDLSATECRAIAEALSELPPLVDELWVGHRFTVAFIEMLTNAADAGAWVHFD